jgi:hypothetical protein
LPELRYRLASKEMKRRSRLASKVTSSIQEHHEDHLPDISSLSSSRTEPSYCPPVNLDLEPTVVVGTAATSIQEQHEDHMSNISNQLSSKTEPSSCPPVNHDLSPAVVAGTAATNTDSSTIDSNNDSPSHPNSQSALLGLASPTIATIQDTVITSPDDKDTIK